MRGLGVGAAVAALLLAALSTTACSNTGRAVLSDGTEVKFTDSEPRLLIPNRTVSPTGTWGGRLRFVRECSCFAIEEGRPEPVASYLVWPAGTEGVKGEKPAVRLPDGRTFPDGTYLTGTGATLGFKDGKTPFSLPEELEVFSHHEAVVITTADEVPNG